MHREGHHVLRHTAIYLVARGAPGVIAFLSIPLFTRLLNPGDFGRYALVLATANLLNALLFQWLRLSLVRYLPTYHDEPARLKSTLATTSIFLIALLGLLAVLLCLLPFSGQWKAFVAPCWIVLAMQAMFDLCCEYSRAALRPWRYMGLQIVRAAAGAGLGAAMIVDGVGWRAPLYGIAIGMGMAVAWAWRDWREVRLVIDRFVLSKLCRYGIPLSLTVALTIVISSSDRFLIAGYLGDDAAGLYSVAVDLTSQTLSLLMMVIQLAMFPIAVRAFEHYGREAAQQQMKVNAALLMGIGLPAVTGLAVLAPGIADCILGKTFRSTAAGIIPIVAVGTFLAGFKAYHFDTAFQFSHRTIHQVWIVLAAAALNVILNVVAIPSFGINGAATASVIAYLFSIALTAWVGRRHFELPFPLGALTKVIVAVAAMALLLYPLRGYHSALALAGQVGAGAMVYGSVLTALNFLNSRNFLLRNLTRQRAAAASLPGSVRTEIDGEASPLFEAN